MTSSYGRPGPSTAEAADASDMNSPAEVAGSRVLLTEDLVHAAACRLVRLKCVRKKWTNRPVLSHFRHFVRVLRARDAPGELVADHSPMNAFRNLNLGSSG